MKSLGVKLDLQGLQFRHWTFTDIPEVIRVNRICLPENYSRGTFLGLRNEFPDLLFLSFDTVENSVVGYIIEKLDEGTAFFGDGEVVRGHIFSLAVLPAYRRRGIGSILLALSFRAARQKGCTEFFLEVRKSNKPAISLYKAFGMEIIGQVPRYYADGETANIMAAGIEDCEKMVDRLIEEVNEVDGAC